MQDKTFTDFELIAIENAFEALLTELDESGDDFEFSEALENIAFAYDLDERMEDRLIALYDEHHDNLFSSTWTSWS